MHLSAKINSVIDGIKIINNLLITYPLSISYLIFGIYFFTNTEGQSLFLGKSIIFLMILIVFFASFFVQKRYFILFKNKKNQNRKLLSKALILLGSATGFIFNSFIIFRNLFEKYINQTEVFVQVKKLFEIEIVVDDTIYENIMVIGYDTMFSFWIFFLSLVLIIYLIEKRDIFNKQFKTIIGAFFYLLAIITPVAIFFAAIKYSVISEYISYFIYFIIGNIMYIYLNNLFSREKTIIKQNVFN